MAGEREAIQAEILSKIIGTDNCGAAEVLASRSVRELLDRGDVVGRNHWDQQRQRRRRGSHHGRHQHRGLESRHRRQS